MGKGDSLTPKQIANKIKAKGLQRLRWYCQLCEKQCRDENGFKCHVASEPHLRQMEVFSNKSSFIVSQYSKEFEEDFLRIMSRQFINSRVLANQVYAEYIKERHHIHMNATEWTTLTEFVKYLGKTSKCIVEETPKGWFITYINRDPDFVMKKESEERKERMELNEEERQRLQIEKQIKELNKNRNENDNQEIKPTQLSKEDLEIMSSLELSIKPTTASLSSSSSTTTTTTTTTTSISSFDRNAFDKVSTTNNNNNNDNNQTNPKPYTKKMSAIDEIMFKAKEKERLQKEKLEFEKQQQQQQPNSNNNSNKEEIAWIIKDIVVKIIDKELSHGKYYKQKGYIVSVENEFLAKVKLLDSGDILKIDQTFLETVIPQVDSTVIIVNGKYRGKEARIESVNFDDFNAKLYLKDNDLKITLPYEDFSKKY
ncbi:hypothetical protein RB653_006919 [Dictyostelium firmibasis]|uniref:DNA/RNA-binding protein Kin17 WH-like domain-containing protein n=1 Tax=Dictyostelium firmibasis TaxID=79012 RepID=A0AAN7TVK5_9MYCE